MYIINNFVLFEMNIAIIVHNEVILHLLYNTVFVIYFFSLELTRCSNEHLQFDSVHI